MSEMEPFDWTPEVEFNHGLVVGLHLMQLLNRIMYAVVFIHERMVIPAEQDEIRVSVTLGGRHTHTKVAAGTVVLLGHDMRFLSDDNRVSRPRNGTLVSCHLGQLLIAAPKRAAAG